MGGPAGLTTDEIQKLFQENVAQFSSCWVEQVCRNYSSNYCDYGIEYSYGCDMPY